MIYPRYKRAHDGFRQLVELLESTPLSRRQKMIDIGMLEDPDYTKRALSYMMTFEDVMNLPDVELAEVMAVAPPQIMAYALHHSPKEVQDRFIRNAKAQVGAAVRDFLDVKIGQTECGSARIRIVAVTRDLEKKGRVRTKHIPINAVA